MKRVTIIGAGITGLACAHRLRELDPTLDIKIITDSGRVGGPIETVKRDGFLIEGGPDAFVAAKPWALDLCKKIGLENEIIGTNEKFRKCFVVRGGRFAPVAEDFYQNGPNQLGFSSSGLGYEALVTLRGGMQLIIDKLVTALPEGMIEYHMPVEDIEGLLTSGSLVLALPANKAGVLLSFFDSELSGALNSIAYSSMMVIHFAYPREAIRHPLDGFGFLVPPGEKISIQGGTFSSVKFEGRAPEGHVLLRAFVRGDNVNIQNVENDLKQLLEIQGPPEWTKVHCHFQSMPQYPQLPEGHSEKVAQIESLVAKHPGLYLAGAAYRGVGIPDCVHDGELTAEKIVQCSQSR